MSGGADELTAVEKLALRDSLATLTGALMRMWTLGMFVARDASEQAELDRIETTMVMPVEPSEDQTATPLRLRLPKPDGTSAGSGLSPLTDEEYLLAFDQIAARFKALASAYRTGMVVAHDDEQRRQLEELKMLLSDRHPAE